MIDLEKGLINRPEVVNRSWQHKRVNDYNARIPLLPIYGMPDLSNYTGSLPNEFALSFIQSLEAEGFTVAPTAQGPIKEERKTLRIFWRGVYIGLMSETLWRRKVPYVCLYRFPKNGYTSSVAKAPFGFDKDEFARQHGCAPDLLYVHTDYSGSYLWVQNETTGLRLMEDWARRIDAAYISGPGDR